MARTEPGPRRGPLLHSCVCDGSGGGPKGLAERPPPRGGVHRGRTRGADRPQGAAPRRHRRPGGTRRTGLAVRLITDASPAAEPVRAGLGELDEVVRSIKRAGLDHGFAVTHVTNSASTSPSSPAATTTAARRWSCSSPPSPPVPPPTRAEVTAPRRAAVRVRVLGAVRSARGHLRPRLTGPGCTWARRGGTRRKARGWKEPDSQRRGDLVEARHERCGRASARGGGSGPRPLETARPGPGRRRGGSQVRAAAARPRPQRAARRLPVGRGAAVVGTGGPGASFRG